MSSTSVSPRQLTSAGSAHLDMLRGLAAIAVMASHWRNFLFVDWAALQHKSVLLSALYFLTGFGHQAVIVFFALSGYLVGGSVLRSMRTDTWDWRRYSVDRISRLGIVLVPALLLCLGWDEIGTRAFHGEWLYSGAAQIAEMQVPVVHSVPVFLGNCAFLQTIRLPVFGSDFPLWSLADEFWYYVMFPLMCLLYFSQRFRVRLPALLMLAVVSHMLPGDVVAKFSIWLMGALLYIAVPTRRLSSFSTLAGIATSVPAMLIFLTAERAGRVPKRAEDFILGLLFAALLYFLIHGRTSVAPAYASGSAFIARSSYTLYLVHFPFFACVAAAMHHRWQPDFKHLSVAVVVFALCYAYAHAVATVFEAHTPVLKQRLLLFTGLTETAS